MTTRDDLIDLFGLDDEPFRARVRPMLAGDDPAAERRRQAVDAGPSSFDGPNGMREFQTLDPRDRDLVWRLWLLDDAPFGLTLSGPAYQDNPVLYATRTFREMSGYSLDDLRGENLRLMQGPETAPAAVDTLREALDTWTRVTVELRNYRRDGTAFTNRLTLVPLADESGTVANWLGVQAAVD